jgi:hypothetical protein
MRATSVCSSPSSLLRVVISTFFALLCCGISLGQTTAAQTPAQTTEQNASSLQPASTQRPLIVQPVEESQLTVLKGNTHPLARREFDLGTAPASLPMQRMLLVLKRSPEQEHSLRTLLDYQQDKHSPSYHTWLTPEQYGKQFGPSDADIETITAWLQSHGFQVSPTKGRTMIEFSGSASQVAEAFHTTIHKYVVNGEQHWANASDPMIPTALTPAVTGVLTMHNFLKKPQIHMSEGRVAANLTPGKKPFVTFSDGTTTLGPPDYATIYNINPTYGIGITGAGVTIGIVGRSNLFNQFGPGNDVVDFRSVFGLPFTNPNIILNGPDPGDLGGGEEAEATLDTTWSGAIAPGANVEFVVSASTNSTDGVDLSELYIVENNLADIMTESFGSCELGATDSDFQGVNALAEQAAAQGITYMVSTGDNGAAGCDDPNSSIASFPVSINVLASTPFTTAVGGTMFNENGQVSTYWGSAPPVTETALSYIPEDVWNESCSTATCGSSANLSAGSGGISTGNVLNGGTFAGVPRPSWQSGVTGIPSGNQRDIPDVSLSAASHDPYLLCLESSCSQGFIFFVWGTSAAAPSFAGVMALIDEQMANTPGQTLRQGQANYNLYRLASAETYSSCNGSNTSVTLNNASDGCVFNDTTVGNNSVPGDTGYLAGVGYDMATGLGSVNVANLVSNWNNAPFNATTGVLKLNNGAAVNVPHGSSVPVNVTVTSATGIPAGDVSLLTGTGPTSLPQSGVDFFNLIGGSVSQSTGLLPGGSYNVWAHYVGDGTHAPSDSNTVAVTVSPESSTTTLSGPFTLDQFGLYRVPFTTLPFGSAVFIAANVQGASGVGTPTGSVAFNATGGTIPNTSVSALNTEGTASVQGNPFLLGGPVVPFDAGQYTISATYSGDLSFNTSSSTTPVSFTITPGFSAAVPGSGTVVSITAPGLSGTTSITIASSTNFSGTINLACAGLPAESACVFSPSSVTAAGVPATTNVTITVTTTAPTASLQPGRRSYYLAQFIAGFGLFGLVLIPASRRRRLPARFLLLMLALLVVVPGCGGGGSNSHGPPPNPGTTPGTYNVQVNATSGSITQSSGFTLFLQ